LAGGEDATAAQSSVRQSHEPAAREEKNPVFGSGNSAGTTVGSGTSLESSPRLGLQRRRVSVRCSLSPRASQAVQAGHPKTLAEPAAAVKHNR